MAVQTLMGGGAAMLSEKPKRSEKNKISDGERVSWGKAMSGVAIYAVLVAAFITIPLFLLGTVITTIASAYDPSIGGNSAGTMTIVAGIVGVSTLVGVFIGIFIQYGLIHFSATTFLSGEGYFTNLLWNMRIPLIAQFLVQVAIYGIMMFMLFSSFSNIDTAAIEAVQATGDISYIPGMDEQLGLINMLNGINTLVALGFTIWISMVIGKTYNFGGVKGCLSIIISNIVLVVAICGCYFAFFMIFANTINQAAYR
jgi:hypothetical protein